MELSYGDDHIPDRRELRAIVWNIAQGRCEHPTYQGELLISGSAEGRWLPCSEPAAELAHIQPRGMGHTGYRDTVNNAIAACTLHARSTDDLSSPEWQHVPEPHDRHALGAWVLEERRRGGWAL